MVRFIDDHRDQYGVEPICAVLPIAPSTYFRQRVQDRDPHRRSRRAQRDDERRVEIQRVWDCGGNCAERRSASRTAPYDG